MTRRALVTGASGFVGASVARVLLESGRTVRVFVRPRSDRRNIPVSDGVEVCEGDLRDASSVARGVRGCDEVYHVAADYRFWARDPGEIYESNVLGTRHVMEACARWGVRKIVHTSTVGTIGLSRQPEPCDEETPMDSSQVTSHYKKSKIEAEHVALEHARQGLPVVIVNPSTPVGPGDIKPTPTGKIILDFLRGKMPAYVDTGLNFIHVRDVARGHLLAAEKGRVGERYILGNQNLSMVELLGMLAEITGRPAPRFRIPYGAAWIVGLVSTRISDYVTGKPPAIALEAVRMSKRYMFFDSSKALRELGLPQSPVREALGEAVEWFQGHGPVKEPIEVTHGCSG